MYSNIHHTSQSAMHQIATLNSLIATDEKMSVFADFVNLSHDIQYTVCTLRSLCALFPLHLSQSY